MRMSSLPETVSFELGVGAAVPARLVSQARTDASAVGYAHGWSQGLREAHGARQAWVDAGRDDHDRFVAERNAALSTAMSALERATAQLEHASAVNATAIEDTILAAAVEIAEALLAHELRSPELAAPSALARVLRLTPVGSPVTISLSPADHAVLTGDDGATRLAEIDGVTSREITLLSRDDLGPGDAIAQCGATTIDGRLSEGLARIREYLAK